MCLTVSELFQQKALDFYPKRSTLFLFCVDLLGSLRWTFEVKVQRKKENALMFLEDALTF